MTQQPKPCKLCGTLYVSKSKYSWVKTEYCSGTCRNKARVVCKYDTVEQVQQFFIEQYMPVSVLKILQYKYVVKHHNLSLVEVTDGKETWQTTVYGLQIYWKKYAQLNSPSVLAEAEKIRRKKTEKTNLEKYGTSTNLVLKGEDGLTDSQRKSLAVHGVESPFKLREFQSKVHEDLKNRTPEQKQAQYDKGKATSQVKYDAPTWLASKEGQLFLENKWLKERGVRRASMCPDVISKIKGAHQENTQEEKAQTNTLIKQTKFQNHGDENYNNRPLATQTTLKRHGKPYYTQTEKYKEDLKEFLTQLKADPERYEQYIKKHQEAFRKSWHEAGTGVRTSKEENEIRQWLQEITGMSWEPSKSILYPKHIDMYNEALKVGLEYSSLFWHNENSLTPRMKMYHYNKYKECRAKGIQLITVWDYLWVDRRVQIQNHLKAILGLAKFKVAARKTIFKEIAKDVSDLFLETHHIQGKNNLDQFRFGLFFQDQLVGLITFGRHHRKSDCLVLNRLCFKDDHQVIGGASKLFKNALPRIPKKKIVSWSENEWSFGKIYETLGFVKEAELPPSPNYTDKKGKFYSLQSQQKKFTGCPKEVTQHEWATQNGLSRFWNCGKVRWVYTLNE